VRLISRIPRRLHSRLGDINSVAQTVQTIEGWFPPGTPGYPNGSLSYRYNNPGNLTYAGQPGASPVQVCNPTCHTFADFDTVADGEAALDNQIESQAGKGQTILQFASQYAPASDGNDPNSYAAQIAANEGLSVSDPLAAALAGGSAAISPISLPDGSGDDSTGGFDFSGILSTLGLDSIDPTVLAAGAVAAGLVLVLAMRD
jgi:hypothetical protein